MKTTALILSLFLGFAVIPWDQSAPITTSDDAEPLMGRCIGLKPLCPIGTRPICICESNISLNCAWLCGSLR